MPHGPPQGRTGPTVRDLGATFRWGWTACVVLATTLPYFIAYAWTPSGYTYTWILAPYPEDAISYLAWTRQALNGHLLFGLKYTAAPHAAFLLQPFFLLAGWLCRASGLSPGIVLLLLKALGVVVFFQVFFGFLSFLRLPRRAAVAAALLAGVASGFGAPLLALFGKATLIQNSSLKSADLWLVDLNTYWSLLWNPLFPYCLALMLATVRCTWEGTETRAPAQWWLGGACTGMLALIHPYHVPFLFLFFAVFTVMRLRWESWRAWVPFCVVAGPFALFTAAQEKFNPLAKLHGITGIEPSPPLIQILLGCGVLVPLAALAVLRQHDGMRREGPLVLWVGLAVSLAYVPLFWFQRKFFFGLQMPLCVLAALGLHGLFRRSAWLWLVIALTTATPIYVTYDKLMETMQSPPQAPYYIADDLMDALRYLKDHTRPSEIVFASQEVSLLIPALAGNTVLWGHWAMSVDSEAQIARLRPLFDRQSGYDGEARARGFWEDTRVRYILMDPWVRASFGEPLPDWLLRTSRTVYQEGNYAILQYTPADSRADHSGAPAT